MAAGLPKNSVGTKQLKKAAVTAAKIKDGAISAAKIQARAITGAQIADGSLTGTQVNASTLGTVPSAVRADRADSLPPAEAWHLVGAPGEPPFLNGWHSFEPASLLEPVAFFKDHEGIVHLKGRATRATSASGFIFALPPGFRPAQNKVLIQAVSCECTSGLVGELDISGTKPAEESNSGVISGPEATTVGFDGITFRAES